jgi:hypothetical protein
MIIGLGMQGLIQFNHIRWNDGEGNDGIFKDI